VALALAVRGLAERGLIPDPAAVLGEPVAAVSVGMIGGEPRLDLVYAEDAGADVDMNVVMTESGKLVGIQGTAQGATFSRDELPGLLDLASAGIRELCRRQREALR